MNHIFVLSLITLGWYVCNILADIDPSNQNISHFACNTKCISKESVDLKQCLSDTGQSLDCTANQLGTALPIEACDYSKAVDSTAEELNEYFNNGRFKAHKWNTIRASLTKGPVSFLYVSEKTSGTVSNIQIIADTETSKFKCQYNFEVVPDKGKSEETDFYTVIEGNGTKWHWGWYLHTENVHVFRSCKVTPTNESYGSIVVYVRESHEKEGDEALKKLTFLDGVKFDNAIVLCV